MKNIWDNVWKESGKYNISEFRRRTLEKVQRITKKSAIFHNAKVLEIGCGDGIVLEEFSRIYENIEVDGIDISEYAIKAATNKKIKNSKFTLCDARNLNSFIYKG